MSADHPNAPIGLIMLETKFPRIPGDIGHAETFDFPIITKTVAGASPQRVVRERADGLLEPFIAAARELEAEGAAGITTSCGFLTLFQRELAAALSVPILTSSLFQVPLLQTLLGPAKKVGIITISETSLSQDHLVAAGITPDTPIGSPEGSPEGGSEFTRAILADETHLDVDKARADNVDAARAMMARHDDLGALVLECTNMAPYAADMAKATGLPVYTIVDFLVWFQRGLQPRRYNS